MEKDLMIIPRLEYEGLLKRLTINEGYEQENECLWKSTAKDIFSKSYSKSDAIYDKI